MNSTIQVVDYVPENWSLEVRGWCGEEVEEGRDGSRGEGLGGHERLGKECGALLDVGILLGERCVVVEGFEGGDVGELFVLMDRVVWEEGD